VLRNGGDVERHMNSVSVLWDGGGIMCYDNEVV